jgi:uroporphyrinogen-III synthase
MLAGPALAARRPPRRILYTGLDPLECLLDGEVVHYPLISVDPIAGVTFDPVQYDGLVFTSRTAVRIFFERWNAGTVPVYAIGQRTSAEIARHSRSPAAVAAIPDSDSLAGLLRERGPARLLYPCADRSRNAVTALPGVDAVPVYRTRKVAQPALDLEEFACAVFTSPSTVESFFDIHAALPAHLTIHTPGAPTARALMARGVPADVLIEDLTTKGGA